ncbi:MAG: glycosyltransferase family 4 protein [Roseiflexus sp.]
MKIALISESPSVATGFGIHARHLTRMLADMGHETVVFGVCADDQPFDPTRYPCRIVPMPRDQKEALPLLPAFLTAERPELIFIHYDLGAVARFAAAVRSAGWTGPMICHFVIDTIPFDRDLMQVVRDFRAAITPTYAAANYCMSLGISNVIAAPHPVDARLFRPLPYRDALRRVAGLDGRFVIGVFGRNTERKQQPRVMMALQQLRARGKADDVIAYFHCQPTNEDPWLGSWNLLHVADHLGVADLVLFPQSDFRQLSGIPYDTDARLIAGSPPDRPVIPPTYTYVERLNLCDLVVNVPHSGAFELAPLEAALCGVPAAVTNDRSAMAEVVGDGAYLLEPIDRAIHSSGGWQHFVGACTIAEAILEIKEDAALQQELIQRGRANALRYTDEPLRRGLREALERAVAV